MIALPVTGFAADGLSFDLSVQKKEDSNVARSHQPESDSILTTTGVLFGSKSFEKQRLALRWSIQDIHFDTRSDLNTVIQNGELGLFSQWTRRLLSEIKFSQNAYEVDQLEFSEKDVVTKQKGTAKVGFGAQAFLSLFLGATKTDQSHSNLKRESLDYKEEEGFFEVTHHTAKKSEVSLFLKSGSRAYKLTPTPLSPNLNPINLDFDYQQLELSADWVLSPKTNIHWLSAAFHRDGELNRGNGTLLALDSHWAPSEKISFRLGYSINRPAIGELSDTPEIEKAIASSVDWQITKKIALGTQITSGKRQYTGNNTIERKETFYLYSPLKIDYQFLKNMMLRSEATIRKNESPLIYRDYDEHEYSVSLIARF